MLENETEYSGENPESQGDEQFKSDEAIFSSFLVNAEQLRRKNPPEEIKKITRENELG